MSLISIEENIRVEFDRFYKNVEFNDLETCERVKNFLDSLEEDVIQQYQRQLDEAFDNGYNEGYEVGHEEGMDNGYDEGYEVGHEEGMDNGYDEGYKQGWKEAEQQYE